MEQIYGTDMEQIWNKYMEHIYIWNIYIPEYPSEYQSQTVYRKRECICALLRADFDAAATQKPAGHDGPISRAPGIAQQIQHTPCVAQDVVNNIHGGIDAQSIDGDLTTRNNTQSNTRPTSTSVKF